MCIEAADAAVTLHESSEKDVSPTNEDVGFTVLEEVKPRVLKKVDMNDYFMLLKIAVTYCESCVLMYFDFSTSSDERLVGFN